MGEAQPVQSARTSPDRGVGASRNVLGARRFSRGARTILQPFRRLRARTGCLKGLDFLWLEITRSCNLTCRHCYAGSGPHLPLTGRMGFADWCRAMDEARSIGCRRLQFIGGEPTVHPDLSGLIEHAKNLGFRHCAVFTNATVLHDDLVESFRRLGVRVAISFYSSDPEAHDQITGQKGSFDRTVGGIRRLVKRRVPLRAAVILMEQNAGHLKETKRFLRRLGVAAIETDRVRGIGRGEPLVPNARPMSELCGDCWNGKLCIDPDGDAYPCIFARFVPVGNFLTDGIKGIVEGEKLPAFRRVSYLGEQGG